MALRAIIITFLRKMFEELSQIIFFKKMLLIIDNIFSKNRAFIVSFRQIFSRTLGAMAVVYEIMCSRILRAIILA